MAPGTVHWLRWYGRLSFVHQNAAPVLLGHFRTRLRTDKQVGLCKRNTRFVLGLLALLGMDDADEAVGMSLGLLAVDEICKAVLAVIDARGIRSQRRYRTLRRRCVVAVLDKLCYGPELAGELRHILAFVFERAHAHKSPKEKSAVKIDTLGAYNMVQVGGRLHFGFG